MKTLKQRAKSLRLHGLLAHWDEVIDAPWVETLIDWEEKERRDRSFERRLAAARLGHFKPLVDFDWSWPEACDRVTVEDLMRLDFLVEGENAVLIGGTGTGKTTLATNIAYQSLCAGHTVRTLRTDPELKNLAAIGNERELARELGLLVRPALLLIDEIGYVTLGERHADILYYLISAREQRHRSTIVVSSRPLSGWRQVFSGSACVSAIIDRLVHKADIIVIKGDSYRLKEAEERRRERQRARRLSKKGDGDR